MTYGPSLYVCYLLVISDTSSFFVPGCTSACFIINSLSIIISILVCDHRTDCCGTKENIYSKSSMNILYCFINSDIN